VSLNLEQLIKNNKQYFVSIKFKFFPIVKEIDKLNPIQAKAAPKLALEPKTDKL
jgi:hypothetical protein